MYPQSTLNRFAELFNLGTSFPKIAAELKVAAPTLYRWRILLGLPKRPAPRGPRSRRPE
jgi:transposase-like protein